MGRVGRNSLPSNNRDEAREALLDCLLVLVEHADELSMKNSTLILDIAADMVFAEIEDRAVPLRTLTRILKLAEAAGSAVGKSHPPEFSSSRMTLEDEAEHSEAHRKSA